MTRIVAGAARGRRLKVPAAGTRPTSDRVREALFSSLDAAGSLRGASVLDLFAGTGALGLEAVSRGAARAVLVDSAPAAAKVIEQNVRTVGLSGVSVHKQTAAAFLAGDRSAFDVVFLDPPYDLSADEVSTVLHSLTRGWLADAALVVLERACRSEGVTWPAGFTVDWQRRFGDTCVQRAVWYGHEQVPPT